MARKLSRIAWQHRFHLLAAALWLLAGRAAPAQDQVQISPAEKVILNPYSQGESPPPDAEPVAPSAERGKSESFRNPFVPARAATLQLAPPVAPPARPGPIARWQRNDLPTDEASSVRAAILDANPLKYGPLSPNDLNRSDAPGLTNFGQPPDPIQFAQRPLTQPAWLTNEVLFARPITSAESAALEPVSIETFQIPDKLLETPALLEAPAAESSTRKSVTIDTFHIPDQLFETPVEMPVAESPAREPVSLDTFQLPDKLLETSVSETTANISDAVGATATPEPPAESDWLPIIVSDFVDSPANCYEQARQIADTGQSVDELTKVIDLCHRGLGAGPSQESAIVLRRLAAWAYNRRGELRSDAREHHDALSDFQAAIALDNGCWAAIHNRGVTLAQRGQSAAARRDFNRAIELNPGLTVAYRNRAELLASTGRVSESVQDYSTALAQNPDDADLYRARASAFQRLGDYDRASDDLNKSIKLAPNQPDAYTQRGNLLAEQGDFERAISNYQQALRIDPNWAEAHRSLAWLWATCSNARYRDAQQALMSAEQAVTLSPPGDSSALDAAAAAEANAGQFGKAIQLQLKAIAAAPPDATPSMRERLALYKDGRPFRCVSSQSPIEPASLEVPELIK